MFAPHPEHSAAPSAVFDQSSQKSRRRAAAPSTVAASSSYNSSVITFPATSGPPTKDDSLLLTTPTVRRGRVSVSPKGSSPASYGDDDERTVNGSVSLAEPDGQKQQQQRQIDASGTAVVSLGMMVRYANSPYGQSRIISIFPRYVFFSTLPFPVLIANAKTHGTTLKRTVKTRVSFCEYLSDE